jgi:UDP-N-acetyl-D-mannosaminuronate dehydrogenase
MMLARLLLIAELGFAGLILMAQAAKSGLDVTGFDRSVAPLGDLCRYVNGGWLRPRTFRTPPE